MSKYQTIQKVAEDMGIDTSLIHSLIKDKEINKYKLQGRKRVFVDIEEIEALIIPTCELPTNQQIDLDMFKV